MKGNVKFFLNVNYRVRLIEKGSHKFTTLSVDYSVWRQSSADHRKLLMKVDVNSRITSFDSKKVLYMKVIGLSFKMYILNIPIYQV